MPSIDILNALWSILANDSEFLSLLNLSTQATTPEKAAKIQKEREPNGLALENCPLVTMYPMDGLPNRLNSMVYDAEVQFDIYASTLYKCMLIEKRIRTLLNNERPPVQDGFALEMEFMGDFAGESQVQGIKKHSQRWVLGDVLWR